MNDIKDTLNYTKKFSVLYVEDEEDIRSSMSEVIEFFFKDVITASNGKEGLELFKKTDPDIVVSDIQMPHMNGLEMIEAIRKIDPDIPVVINTAYNDQDYFLKSIELKIDQYLLKPINQKQAQAAFDKIARILDDRNKAKELEHIKIQQKINNASNYAVNQIIDAYQSPCIIIQEDSKVYINQSFCAFFKDQCRSDISADKLLHEEIFDKKEGFISSLKEYDPKHFEKNIVSISLNKGRKIYRVIKKDMNLQENENAAIYLFIDITLEEYQKIKIENYLHMLEDFIFSKHYSSMKKETPKAQESHESLEEKDEQKEQKGLKIDEKDTSVLRRSHQHKTTAEEYVQEIDDDVIDTLHELGEIDDEMKELIESFGENPLTSTLEQISQKLEAYAKEINLLFEFADLSYAIRSLSMLLAKVTQTQIEQKGAKNISILLSGIQSDLEDWRKMIFVDKSAIDIHYLDSSLFSVCLQIELLLSDEVSHVEEEDEEDLVFF